jgi:ferrochelatase
MQADPWADIPHEVVLCNFGGPESAADVEPFLRRLFEDPFIIRSRWIPQGLRHWIARRIARKRAPRIGVEYAKIGYSPINRTTRATAAHLERLLGEIRPGTKVHVCNRYTAPFADEVVAKLDIGRSRVFMIALYPHLCHSTTVSSFRDFDLAFRARHGDRVLTTIRVNSWWFARSYLDYSFGKLREGLEATFAKAPGAPVQVIFSAHGIPESYNLRGDPYVNETRAHFDELRRRAEHWLRSYASKLPAGASGAGASLPRVDWHLSFQSRVGPVQWVGPYTDELVQRLGREAPGAAVLLVPISFTSDHIETLFEMDETYREQALASGFRAYHRVVPPNDDPLFAECLREILEGHGF